MQHIVSDPDAYQNGPESDGDRVQIDSVPGLVGSLVGCSVWWVLRGVGETEGGITFDAQREGADLVGRTALEDAARGQAVARDACVLVWLVYRREEDGRTYERPALWAHPGGRVVWHRGFRPGRSPAAVPGADAVEVLASLPPDEGRALGDAFGPESGPEPEPEPESGAGQTDASDPMFAEAWREACEASLRDGTAVQVAHWESRAGTADPVIEVYCSRDWVGRWDELLHVASRQLRTLSIAECARRDEGRRGQ